MALLYQFDYWWSGVKDALNWPVPVIVMYNHPPIWRRNLDCLKLNGLIFITSLVVFQYILDPFMHWLLDFGSEGDDTVALSLSALANTVNYMYILAYYVLYVYPVYVLSFVLNAIWYQEIADRAYAVQVGEMYVTPNRLASLIAEEIYRLLLVLCYTLQCYVLGCIPFVGGVLGFVSLCWLNSFYCFEYKWVNMGYPLQKRLDIFQGRWAYYFGFGAPFTAVCVVFPGVMSGGVFALLFPMYVIMANSAKPRPYRIKSAPDSRYVPRIVPMFYLCSVAVRPLIRWMDSYFWAKKREAAEQEQEAHPKQG